MTALIETLRGLALTLPIDVPVAGATLHCTQLLRHLPGKRIVCGGTFGGRDVVAKIYVDPHRAHAHAQREARGVRAMMESGIVTPALLHDHADRDFQVLIFERIFNASSVLDLWYRSDRRTRERLLEQMVHAVAALHRAGLSQADLHLGNFLYTCEHLYAIDGDGIRITGSLGRERALDNLALLIAQLQPDNDVLFPGAYRHYAAARGWSTDDANAEAFAMRAKARRAACHRDHLAKKIFRECTAFSARADWRQFMVVDRRYDSPELRAALADIDRTMSDGQFLKQGRTSTVSKVHVGGVGLVIKRYNIKGFWHGVRRAVQPTRAAISWRNAQRLMLYGLPTPLPIALVERRFGPLRRVSYFVTAFHDGESAAAYFARVGVEHAVPMAQRVVALLRQLRRLKLGHGDLKATNLLICGSEVLLTDLDALVQHRDGAAAERAHAKDLQRFMRNWEGQPALRALFARLLDEPDVDV